MTSSIADRARGTVLVTGASRGLGRALADLYAADGFRVIACTRQGPGEPLDVADAASIAALGERLKGVPVDIVYTKNNFLCTVRLGEEWRVRMADTLLANLNEWTKPDGVEVTY